MDGKNTRSQGRSFFFLLQFFCFSLSLLFSWCLKCYSSDLEKYFYLMIISFQEKEFLRRNIFIFFHQFFFFFCFWWLKQDFSSWPNHHDRNKAPHVSKDKNRMNAEEFPPKRSTTKRYKKMWFFFLDSKLCKYGNLGKVNLSRREPVMMTFYFYKSGIFFSCHNDNN